MGVIYIGDRAVGKTHLALALASPRSQHVRVLQPDYENLKSLLTDDEDSTRPTEAISFRFLEFQASLPAGSKSITVDWIDTPGEMWRKRWQDNNPNDWQDFLENSRKSEGILLILNPYRETLPASCAFDYSNQQQWCSRFEKWADFFRDDCPKARHIILCLNKADLFVDDLDQESSRLAFDPNGSTMTWRKRHSYVLHKYLRPIQPQIEHINRSTRGLSVQCFITSIYSRPLLELPWIYMASFLAK
ncbi:hypothetical protein [Sphaerothrix gracilis]|uniref:hypothetical protein n=1 Tax=Sphaerothrix gracilis TaxID=3151835 RepID=UPI0031FD91D7